MIDQPISSNVHTKGSVTWGITGQRGRFGTICLVTYAEESLVLELRARARLIQSKRKGKTAVRRFQAYTRELIPVTAHVRVQMESKETWGSIYSGWKKRFARASQPSLSLGISDREGMCTTQILNTNRLCPIGSSYTRLLCFLGYTNTCVPASGFRHASVLCFLGSISSRSLCTVPQVSYVFF